MGPDFVDFFYGGAVFLCVSTTVRDTATYLDAVAGTAPGEPYALTKPSETYLSATKTPPARLRIGVSPELIGGGELHPENRAAVEAVAKQCEKLGHAVEEKVLDINYTEVYDNYTHLLAVLTAAQFVGAERDPGRCRASDLGGYPEGPEHQQRRSRDPARNHARPRPRNRHQAAALRRLHHIDLAGAATRARALRHVRDGVGQI
jgi:Asp-tRNA(Asn)/Glu-tRNA(Gln) amidotransferase A subunit family amidase